MVAQSYLEAWANWDSWTDMSAAAQAAYERLDSSPVYNAEQASEDKKKARQRKAF